MQLSKVQLGADNVNKDFRVLNKGGVIFDSGSTDSVLPVALKAMFLKVNTSTSTILVAVYFVFRYFFYCC